MVFVLYRCALATPICHSVTVIRFRPPTILTYAWKPQLYAIPTPQPSGNHALRTPTLLEPKSKAPAFHLADQDGTKHRKFVDKSNLNFTLLADPKDVANNNTPTHLS